MEISKPTYLIAELTGDAKELVCFMREKYNPHNVNWPADITIAGSSGIGTLCYGQTLDEIVDVMQPIVSQHYFTNVEFIGIDSFPDTGIYYLKPKRQQFDEFHNAIKNSGLKFNENEWPYNPHCTLHWKDQKSDEVDNFFKNLIYPKQSTIECFSLYQPEIGRGERIFRFDK